MANLQTHLAPESKRLPAMEPGLDSCVGTCGPQTDPENRVGVIVRRALTGECLVAALQAADPSSSYKRLSSMSEWLHSYKPGRKVLTVLYVEAEEGKQFGAGLERSVEELRRHDPIATFSILSTEEEESPDNVVKALELGAQGYLTTNHPLMVVVQAFKIMIVGGIYIPASSLLKLSTNSPKRRSFLTNISALSPQELKIAKGLRRGAPNKAIAYDLGICEGTVKVHVRSMMKKLKTKNRTEIAFLMSQIDLKS